MEVVEEIDSIGDDRLDFLETFEKHREELLHVLKNTYAITAAVLGEDYLRRIVETYFGLRDNIISMVDRMDVLEANLSRWSVAMGFPPATLMRAGAEIISGSWHEK